MFSYTFMQHAFIGGILVAIACGLLGPFLVLKKLSLVGDGLSHVAFAGIAIGLFFGFNPLLSALITVIVGSILLKYMLSKKMYGDAAIAVLLSLGVGIGIILIGIRKGFTVDLFSYLIGSILSLSRFDISLISTLLVFVTVFIGLFYKQLFYSTFHEDLASLKFKNIDIIQTFFFILTACVVILSIRAVGILLVTALLVLPTLIALRVGSSFKQTLFFSILANMFAVIVGIFISYFADIPPSGSIVVLLFSLFMCSIFYARYVK